MYRVFLSALSLLTVTGCSMGTSPSISSGFANSTQTASVSPRLSPSATLGGEPATAPRRSKSSDKRVASLGSDAAPSGSFAKAPKGSLSDRNFQGASLDMEKARALVNAYRKSKGLKPLRLDAKLTAAAKLHARDLARWDRISHYGSDGSNPWDRVKRSGYNAKLAAENVGTGQASIDEVFRGWQKSPGHNKNLLLPDADHMGIALVHDKKTEFKTFWTLVIGAKL